MDKSNGDSFPLQIEGCNAQLHVKNGTLHSQNGALEQGHSSDSDLYYLFLSVKDCPKSITLIRSKVEAFMENGLTIFRPRHETFESVGLRLSLLGIYSLLGTWDLLVRFRLAPHDKHKYFVRMILAILLEEQMVVDDAVMDGEQFLHDLKEQCAQVRQAMPDADPEDLFDTLGKEMTRIVHAAPQLRSPFSLANAEVVDVQSESGTYRIPEDQIKGFKGQAVEIRRSTLTKQQYEAYRCQRGAIYVKLPSLQQERIALYRRLNGILEKHHDVASIIQSANVGLNALVYDLLVGCGESWKVNHINQLIEPALTDYSLQKYNVSCYEHLDLLLSWDKSGVGNPNGQRIKAFISSTSEDLRAYRDRASVCVSARQWEPIDQSTASNESAYLWDDIERKIRTCKVFICLIGDRFGQVSDEDTDGNMRSVVQREFALARELEKTQGMKIVVCFTKGKRYCRKRNNEKPQKARLQKAFRERVRTLGYKYLEFADLHELETMLRHTLSGWTKL